MTETVEFLEEYSRKVIAELKHPFSIYLAKIGLEWLSSTILHNAKGNVAPAEVAAWIEHKFESE